MEETANQTIQGFLHKKSFFHKNSGSVFPPRVETIQKKKKKEKEKTLLPFKNMFFESVEIYKKVPPREVLVVQVTRKVCT